MVQFWELKIKKMKSFVLRTIRNGISVLKKGGGQRIKLVFEHDFRAKPDIVVGPKNVYK